MASILLYKFTINSVDVTSHVLENTKIVLTRSNEGGNYANIVLAKSVSAILPTLTAGMTVSIERGVVSATESKKFAGRIKTIIDDQNTILIGCFDDIQELKYKYFTTSYDRDIDIEAGEISAIAQDIIEEGGFTASVVATGTASTDVTIKKYISKDQTRYNRIKRLAKIVDYLFYQDYDNDWIRFEPVNSTTHSTPLIVGTNVFNVPVWEEDLESVRNQITVKGAFEEDTREEKFNGDGAEDTFTLTGEPVITECTVGGVLQTRGITDSTTGFDYTVDPERKTFTFESGSVPGVGVANVVMKYTTRIPAPAVGNEPSSIALYNVTQEEIFTYDDIINVEDAETRLDALLSQLAFAKATTNLETDEYDLQPGILVEVQDINNPARDDAYTIQTVVINYPDIVDQITIGEVQYSPQEIFESIQTRIRDIEEKETNLTQLLRHVIGLSRVVNYERRYTKLQKDTVSGSTGIYGYPGPRGKYNNNGTSVYGVDGEVLVIEQFIQGKNTFKEYLYDEDFKDTGNTTATWNTGTKEITFTSGQVAQTTAIGLGTSSSFFTVSIPALTGSVLTEISGDNGSTWQTVTLDLRTAFTSSDGTGILLRITESDTSTATIANTYDAYGDYTLPSIKLILED